ncbi:MAG: MATE family efflux transporter [Actinobacteria bacterium]|nr:MATE family efflux transporter [Actinomycetota bacterium]
MLNDVKKYFNKIIPIALPIIVQGLIFQLQTLINRAFLGNLKLEYLSVLGNVTFPYFTTLSIMFGISIGTTIVVAQNIGAKKMKEAKMYSEASIGYNLLLSTILFFIWFFFSKKIFSIIGVDNILMDYCVSYVQILSFSLIIFGVDTSIQSILLGIGLTKPIMYSGVCKVALNILLDWVLIFGKLGFPELGLKGAALSTTISNIVATGVLVAYIFISKKLPFKFSLKEILRARWGKYRDVIKVGIPAGFEQFAWHFANLFLIRALNSISNIAVGIYALTFGMEVLVFCVYTGIGKSTLALIGYKIGERNEKEAKSIMNVSIIYSIFITCIFSLSFILFSKQISSIFTNDKLIIEKAAFFLIITSFILFPKSLNAVVGNGIRGTGDTKWMLYTQLFGAAFIIVASYILIFVLKVGIIGIYITLFSDELIRSILNLIRFYKMKNKPVLI